MVMTKEPLVLTICSSCKERILHYSGLGGVKGALKVEAEAEDFCLGFIMRRVSVTSATRTAGGGWVAYRSGRRSTGRKWIKSVLLCRALHEGASWLAHRFLAKSLQCCELFGLQALRPPMSRLEARCLGRLIGGPGNR